MFFQLFSGGWHKIHVAVNNDTIRAAVDCVEVGICEFHSVFMSILLLYKEAVSRAGARVHPYFLFQLKPLNITEFMVNNTDSFTIVSNGDNTPASVSFSQE